MFSFWTRLRIALFGPRCKRCRMEREGWCVLFPHSIECTWRDAQVKRQAEEAQRKRNDREGR